jgi:hypothetical protein
VDDRTSTRCDRSFLVSSMNNHRRCLPRFFVGFRSRRPGLPPFSSMNTRQAAFGVVLSRAPISAATDWVRFAKCRGRSLSLLLWRFSKAHPWSTTVLVDELDPGQPRRRAPELNPSLDFLTQIGFVLPICVPSRHITLTFQGMLLSRCPASLSRDARSGRAPEVLGPRVVLLRPFGRCRPRALAVAPLPFC